jgi:hypothetical protein
MKVYFYIDPLDLENLNNILRDYNNIEEPIDISFNQTPGKVMVSLSIDDYIGLTDNDTIIPQIIL